jgi:hypothetical protein
MAAIRKYFAGFRFQSDNLQNVWERPVNYKTEKDNKHVYVFMIKYWL